MDQAGIAVWVVTAPRLALHAVMGLHAATVLMDHAAMDLHAVTVPMDHAVMDLHAVQATGLKDSVAGQKR